MRIVRGRASWTLFVAATLVAGCPRGAQTDAGGDASDGATSGSDAGDASAGASDSGPAGDAGGTTASWYTCLCSDCTTAGGGGVTDQAPICSNAACGDAPALAATCATACAAFGLTACASTTVVDADPCCVPACTRCAAAAPACEPGLFCHPQAGQCGFECNGPADCPGSCLGQPGTAGVCAPPPAVGC